jgi:N-acyl homoserine lactone hydrolase
MSSNRICISTIPRAAGRFPNAVHLVQRKEMEYAFAPDWFSVAAFIRKDFDRPGVNWQFLEDEADDGADLFGDGAIRMFFTPGHAPGHQSFLVNLPKTGPMLLTMDAAYTLDHWNEKALPGYSTSAVEAVRSVKKLHRIAANTGARVVSGHDPDDWANFKKAPDDYD